MSRLFQIALLLTTLSIVGCAPIRDIQTNKLTDYTSQPQRIVFVPVIAGSLEGDQVNLFEREFLASLRECGLRVTAMPVSAAPPNALVIVAAARGIGGATSADSVLVVRTAEKGISTKYGQISVGYVLSLDDLVSKRTVWKAIAKVDWRSRPYHRTPGHDIAAAAVASMQKDNLLPQGCASAK